MVCFQEDLNNDSICYIYMNYFFKEGARIHHPIKDGFSALNI